MSSQTRQMESAQTPRTDRPMAEPHGIAHEQTQVLPGRDENARQFGMTRPDRVVAPMRGDETKPSLKSTEFYIYLAAVAAVLLASQLVGRNSVGVDVFRADRAWWFITLLTIGYLVSRGLAKAGSSIWRRSEADRGAQAR